MFWVNLSVFSKGKPKVELTYDRMYTVTSRLAFTVNKEDDGVPVVCIVDHPAVKDFQAQKYLEVQCEYPSSGEARLFEQHFNHWRGLIIKLLLLPD